MEDLCTFHDDDYVEFLLSYRETTPSSSPAKKRKRSLSSSSESSKSSEDPFQEYGLEYVVLVVCVCVLISGLSSIRLAGKVR
jgi:hypothetical protein